MARRNVIHVYEHDELPYSHFSIGTPPASLEVMAERHEATLFSFYRHHLRTHQYVGLVQTSSETIQILPKVYEHEQLDNLGFLIMLLRLTGTLKIHLLGAAELKDLKGSFLEVWIRYFAQTLNRLLKQRFRRDYVDIERRTGFIRGKLRMEVMHTGRETLTGRYPCRFEIFTPDNLLNQTLKFCNELLLEQAQHPRTLALLRANRIFLRDVADRPITLHDLDRIHLNRLSRAYEPLLDLCRLLLSQATLDVRSGRISQLTFLFDMNVLFEKAVAALIDRLISQLRIGGRRLRSVEPHVRLGYLFGQFRMIVDLVLEDEDGRRILLDTKYKSLNGDAVHGGLSQSDFYQMHAYATAGRRSYDTVILLYPSLRHVARRYSADAATVHVRSVNPQLFYDADTGMLARRETINALNEALDITWR